MDPTERDNGLDGQEGDSPEGTREPSEVEKVPVPASLEPARSAPEAVTPPLASQPPETAPLHRDHPSPGQPGSPEEEDGRRPTPVRTAMEGEEEDGDEDQDAPRTVRDPRSGQDWVVWVSGRSGSGIIPLRTIPLMELSFALAEEPEKPLRRATCQGAELAAMADDEVVSFLRASNPHRSPRESSPSSQKKGRKNPGRKRPR